MIAASLHQANIVLLHETTRPYTTRPCAWNTTSGIDDQGIAFAVNLACKQSHVCVLCPACQASTAVLKKFSAMAEVHSRSELCRLDELRQPDMHDQCATLCTSSSSAGHVLPQRGSHAHLRLLLLCRGVHVCFTAASLLAMSCLSMVITLIYGYFFFAEVLRCYGHDLNCNVPYTVSESCAVYVSPYCIPHAHLRLSLQRSACMLSCTICPAHHRFCGPSQLAFSALCAPPRRSLNAAVCLPLCHLQLAC